MLEGRALSAEEYEREAKPALRRVCRHDDPFHAPFQDTVRARTILYPLQLGPRLDAAQLRALVEAARAVGDEALYYSQTEGETTHLQLVRAEGRSELVDPALGNLGQHWLLPLDDVRQHDVIGPYLDNALYSPRGSWAVLVSHDEFAVAGGSAKFVEVLHAGSPADERGLNARDAVRRWLDDKRGSATDGTST